MSSEQNQAVVGIVGGGLVGSLNAIYFAQRGWKVELYELRPGKDFLLTIKLPLICLFIFPTICNRYATSNS